MVPCSINKILGCIKSMYRWSLSLNPKYCKNSRRLWQNLMPFISSQRYKLCINRNLDDQTIFYATSFDETVNFDLISFKGFISLHYSPTMTKQLLQQTTSSLTMDHRLTLLWWVDPNSSSGNVSLYALTIRTIVNMFTSCDCHFRCNFWSM